MGIYEKNLHVTERDMLKVASFVCRYSPGNILLIGGGCVLYETAGYKRMRDVSDDLDFIVNDEGLAAIKLPLNLRNHYKNGQSTSSEVSYVNDILVGFFHRNIRGWNIPEEIFNNPRVKKTSEGTIYMIPAEINIALKIRRGASRSEGAHIFGKDALDAASIFLGMNYHGERFDSKLFLEHLGGGVCSVCKLTEPRQCIAHLGLSEKQLFDGERKNYSEFIESCHRSLNDVCNKK